VSDIPQHQIALSGEHLAETLYSLSPDGAVLFISRTCERFLGAPAVAICDNPGLWPERVDPDHGPRLRDMRRRLVDDKVAVEATYRVNNPATDRHHVLHDCAVPVLSDDGAVVRIDGVLRDLTPSAARDDDLERQQRMESLGRMTSAVAHSFNNILTVISGYSSALEDNPQLDPLERRAVGQIGVAADRAADLSHRLVAYARGDEPVTRREFQVVRLLMDARDLLRGILSRSIELKMLAESDLPPLAGDSLRLQMALLHLAANSRDAMPRGGTLTLSAELDPDAAGGLLLKLVDDGDGMTSDVLARARDPYFTTRDQATGLGLTLVEEIVTEHGGTLELSSTPGSGTTVVMRLPVSP
jgi:signal transduction histidine kinase